MKKISFGIIFAIIMISTIGFVSAAIGVGSWVENNEVELSITQGQTAEFRYGVTAVTIYDGRYSIMLYREENSVPLVTYVNNQPTITNGAIGRFNITPQDYQNTIGNYYILIKSSDKFSSDTFRLNLNVMPKPIIVTCNATPNDISKPLNVAFTSSATGGTGSYTYTWNYGDGQTTSTTQNNIQHLYPNEGTYNPTLTIKDSNNNVAQVSCGTVTINNPITPITATCSISQTSGIKPLNVIFTSNVNGGSGIYTYQWNFNDGVTQTASQNTQTHTYINSGTYNPTLTIKDSNNNVYTTTCGQSAIKVYNPLEATCSVTPNTGTAPLQTTLNSVATGGTGSYTYTWSYGDGQTTTNNQNSQTHTYNVEGTYNTKLTIKDSENNIITTNCGVVSANNPITPITTICTVTPTSGTAPLNVSFNSFTSGGSGTYSYTWSFGDGTSETGTYSKILAYTYTKAGTYPTSLIVKDSNNNIATTSCGTVTINNPVTPITATCNVTPKGGISPLNVEFNSKVEGGSGSYTYTWNFNDGTTSSNAKTATHTYTQGTYNPTLTIKDSNNNIYTANCAQTPVIVLNPISGTCTLTQTNTISPSNVIFTSNIVGGTGTYTYQWKFGEGQTTTNNQNSQTHTYNIVGTYYPTLIVSDTNSNIYTTTCEPSPVKITNPIIVSCSATPKNGTTPLGVTFTSQVTGGTKNYTYTWNYGDGTTSNTQTGATHTYNNQGTYTTTLTIKDSNNNIATANCGTITTTYPMQPITGTCNIDPTNGLTPLTVSFSVPVSGGMRPYTYTYNYESTKTSYNQGSLSTYTYMAAGTYNPTVIITDAVGTTKTLTCPTIKVNNQIPQLTATCNVNPKTGTKPLNTQFNITATGGFGSYTYYWNFKDGTTQTTTQNIQTHTYNNIGTYLATVNITDNSGKNIKITCPQITVTEIIKPFTVSCSANPINGTAPLNVTLKATTQGETNNCANPTGCVKYEWNYGNGINATTTINNTKYIYQNKGTYKPSVRAINEDGRIATATCGIITVEPKCVTLEVTCVAKPISGYNPLDVNFSVSVKEGSEIYPNYYWDYGDSNTQYTVTSNTTTHRYTRAGTFSPFVAVIDSCGNVGTTYCQNIQVYDHVAIDMQCAVNPNSGNTPLIVTLNAIKNFDANVIYTYYYGDGTNTTTSQMNVSHVYNTGTYTPRITAKNTNGNVGSVTCPQIKVEQQISEITATCNVNPKTGTTPLQTTFTSQVSGGTGSYTYTWNYGDGTTSNTQQTTTHTYNNQGTYLTQLTIKDANNNQKTITCGTITTTNPIPQLNATCNINSTNGLTPLITQFNSIVTGGTGSYTYQWNYGNGQITTNNAQTVTYTYNNAGIYTTQLTVKDANNNSITTNCGTITVTNPTPELTVSCNSNQRNGTSPLIAQFTSNVNGGTGSYTYQWNYGEGQIVTNNQNTQTYTYNNAGIYTTQLTVKDANNKTAIANCGIIVVTNTCPTCECPTCCMITANAGGPYSGYINEQIQFNASLSVGPIVQYKWDFGDGTIISTNSPLIEHSYSKINRYIVTLTVYNAQGNSDSATTQVLVTERTANTDSENKEEHTDSGILVTHLMLYGINGEILKSNDELTTQIDLKNDGSRKLENVRVIVSIPELGIEARSETYDLNRGATHDDIIVLPMYDVPKGIYYVKILVENDDGNEQVKRIKYREIIVN
jgi:PKD repeat protein